MGENETGVKSYYRNECRLCDLCLQNSPGAPNSPTMFSFSEETRNPLYMKRMEEFQMQSPHDLRRYT